MKYITEKEFYELMHGKSDPNLCEDNVFEGLKIIAKYTKSVISGADHDVIYSEDINVLIEAGITQEDIKKLCILGWMIHGLDEDDDGNSNIEDGDLGGCYLACFV